MNNLEQFIHQSFSQFVDEHVALATIEAKATYLGRRFGGPCRILVPEHYWYAAKLPLDKRVIVWVDGFPVRCIPHQQAEFNCCAWPR